MRVRVLVKRAVLVLARFGARQGAGRKAPRFCDTLNKRSRKVMRTAVSLAWHLIPSIYLIFSLRLHRALAAHRQLAKLD